MMKKHSDLVILSAFLFAASCGSEAENANDTCVSSSSSFRVFPSLCELVDVSCGGGQILTHQSNSTAQVGDKIITTHVFLDANGASVEVFEECGTVCSGNGEMTTVAGGCKLEDVIEGDTPRTSRGSRMCRQGGQLPVGRLQLIALHRSIGAPMIYQSTKNDL